MRVISQRGMPVIIDLPYEQIGVSQLYEEPNKIIGFDVMATGDNFFYLAKYSTPDKSEKAMQKLYRQYQEGKINTVFRFPQEDEM